MGCLATSGRVLIETGADLPPDEVIFGSSPAMGCIRKKLEKAARTNIAILLRGQSGTGKEILAKLIHSRSPWAGGPFVKVNCPAIPGSLVESELFGYEKGAFTGAFAMKPGRVELANRGTLFLDEIAELDPSLQAKLLQLLQDSHFQRIGAHEEKKIEVRFVCATNRRLEKEMESGNFRQDLFYRINALTLDLPPLRERLGDIPLLVDYFLGTFSKQFQCPVRPLSNRLLADLQSYSWPGNIRELENLTKSYVIFGSEEEIRSAIQNRHEDFFQPEIPTNGEVPLKRVVRAAVKQLERKIILETLEAHGWNRREAARALSISYTGLLIKMREAGVGPSRGPRAITKRVPETVNKRRFEAQGCDEPPPPDPLIRL